MAAPNLPQRYGNRTHGQDILLGHASHGRHSVLAVAAAKVLDWFDRAARTAWRTASGMGWRGTSGAEWRGAGSGGWRGPASGSWREDC